MNSAQHHWPRSISHLRQDRRQEQRTDAPGMLVSPVFWVGGALSVGIWAGIAALLLG